MKLKNVDAQIYIPDRKNIDEAISRTTHMSIAAHPDDIEIMSYDGIAKCLQNNEKWFFGIVVTNGTGSIKVGKYSNCTDNEYKNVRSDEQKMAADIGDYGALVLLDYKSSEIKNPNDQDVVNDLTMLLDKSRPHTVYAHNLADKHITHVAVAVKTIKAIRNIPYAHRPKELYGCEIWRSLDWMLDEDKIVFDVDLFNDTAWKLLKVFDSQISGAKKYDEATMARRLSNSTFYNSSGTDSSNALSFAMDLTPLIKDDSLDIPEYVQEYLHRFQNNVINNIKNIIEDV